MPAETESDVVEVNRGLLKELEDMGFSMARAAWALHHSGNSSLEAAVNWIVDHENDSQFDKIPVVEFNIEIQSPSPHDDTAQARANELKERARKLREEEETKREREREKERIRAGKELMEAKRIAEENERKRNIALRKAEKDEEKKAREKIMQKVNADKAERKSRLGLPMEAESASTSSPLDTKRILMPSPSQASKAEEMRECLRSLRRNHKDEDPITMRRAFETLLMIVRNAAKNPDEEKYRRIRVTNRLFQERVGRFEEGMEFMELCGFKREGESEFLSLVNHEGDMSRLRDAAFQLQSAVTNPFFGLLSKEAA
ncbi:Ubiquitin-associated [Hirschfeldia incana]|nr:Ubiquitin-associated [Hirschfeldia incana]